MGPKKPLRHTPLTGEKYAATTPTPRRESYEEIESFSSLRNSRHMDSRDLLLFLFLAARTTTTNGFTFTKKSEPPHARQPQDCINQSKKPFGHSCKQPSNKIKPANPPQTPVYCSYQDQYQHDKINCLHEQHLLFLMLKLLS